MEGTTDCRQTDIVCIADELLARWDALEQEAPAWSPDQDAVPEDLPALIRDWAFED